MNAPVADILSRIDQLTKDELNELEKTLTRHTGFRNGQRRVDALPARPPGYWKRMAVIIGISAAALAVAIGIITFLTKKETLAASNRKDEFGANVGYRVDQYRFRSRSRLSFDTGSGSSLVYNFSPLVIEKIERQSWLANGRLIYLNLSVKPGSRAPASPARIIYDFHRGETYIYSPLNLTRTASSNNQWMNEAEFDGLLARFVE
ncbi:MAG: hypothetical protein J2P41_11095 [Blastocatellia bacterium]|nr:hypothetical protein [Blastocatellia bacterium]